MKNYLLLIQMPIIWVLATYSRILLTASGNSLEPICIIIGIISFTAVIIISYIEAKSKGKMIVIVACCITMSLLYLVGYTFRENGWATLIAIISGGGFSAPFEWIDNYILNGEGMIWMYIVPYVIISIVSVAAFKKSLKQ